MPKEKKDPKSKEFELNKTDETMIEEAFKKYGFRVMIGFNVDDERAPEGQIAVIGPSILQYDSYAEIQILKVASRLILEQIRFKAMKMANLINKNDKVTLN